MSLYKQIKIEQLEARKAKLELQKKQSEKIEQLEKQLTLIRSVFKIIGMYIWLQITILIHYDI